MAMCKSRAKFAAPGILILIRRSNTWLTSSNGNQTVFTATLKQATPDPGAPVVDAGADQTILITDAAQLHGTVTDDGLPDPVTPPGAWPAVQVRLRSAIASALDTTASFSTIGDYLLKLTSDGYPVHDHGLRPRRREPINGQLNVRRRYVHRWRKHHHQLSARRRALP